MLLSEHIRDCACFVYVLNRGAHRPVGTAFFLGVPIGKTERHAVLVVTALHVIAEAQTDSDDHCIYLRVNTRDQGHQFVKVNCDDWVRPDQKDAAVDVAVCWWPFAENDLFDFKYLTTSHCLTQEVITSESIGVGSDLFFTCLFVSHHGKERNVPIVRVGNIATMPGELVNSRIGSMEAYLVEARSVGGLSGSPVFVYLGTTRWSERGTLIHRAGGSTLWYLLGVMHGHWQAKAGKGVSKDEAVDDGLSTEYVNMGIAIVTPISKVLDLLTKSPLKEALEAITKQAGASA